MKSLILSFILLSTVSVFACPGGTAITVESPLTNISGDKVTGVLKVTNVETAGVSTIELKELPVGSAIVLPAKATASKVSTMKFVVTMNNRDERVYNFTFNGKTEEINPNWIPRGGCGFELKI